MGAVVPAPAWWPEALAATRRRREYTAQLLTHATPSVDHGRLLLEFPAPDLVADWHDSRAGDALDGALEHLGRAMPNEAVSLPA
ncbi:hypothetical protein ACF09Y_22275 [Streptomyces massasporeus]|uniref:hypothetical protein n=1 Tax=Streptomyces massasporeus TaxID=67324 RepID=UPI0036F8D9F3